jgi:hypothetical protein
MGPERDEVTGGWKKMRNEELRDFYTALNVFRVIKMGRMKRMVHSAHMRDARKVHHILVVKIEEATWKN